MTATIIVRARNFAMKAHYGQERKYTDEPYIVHPIRVAELVAEAGGSYEMIAAAYLHDVVEDCGISLIEIHCGFGIDVAVLVNWLTDVSAPEDGNRAIRKARDRGHLAAAPPDAQTIKLADLIDNTSSITKYDPNFAVKYMQEKRALLEVMDKGDPVLYKRAWNLVLDWERRDS
jgi:(p)ppGpp synthase/HD superfamily hydrolase